MTLERVYAVLCDAAGCQEREYFPQLPLSWTQMENWKTAYDQLRDRGWDIGISFRGICPKHSEGGE